VGILWRAFRVASSGHRARRGASPAATVSGRLRPCSDAPFRARAPAHVRTRTAAGVCQSSHASTRVARRVHARVTAVVRKFRGDARGLPRAIRQGVNLSSWLFFAAACTFAAARAVVAAPPPVPPPANEAVQRAAFIDIAEHEREMRQDAAKSFPTDPWSQDDAFHDLERKRAITFARGHSVRTGDVLDAIDRGMREGWAQTEEAGRTSAPLVATVPPCRPRAIY
jgi:hypothetical protein